ncbi:MAG: hypothetical protein AB7T49_04870 [Oligoflexales bacterium]
MKVTTTKVIALSALVIFGCSKKDSKSNNQGKETEEVDNALADAFPGSLAISAFPQNEEASLALGETVDDPNETLTVKEKVEQNRKVLNGDADCIDMDVFRDHKAAPTVTCYEFDSDMNPARFDDSNTDFGTVDGTDGDGEACMVTFARKEVKDAVTKVDQALALVSGAMCQAKKDGEATELPAEGESLDLAESFGNAIGDFFTVDQAKIHRLADIDDKPVYRTDIIISAGDSEMEVHLVHSPGGEDEDAGTLWFKTKAAGAPKPLELAGNAHLLPPADNNNVAHKSDVMSINYARTKEDGDKRVRFEVRQAMIDNSYELFTPEGLVNYAGVPDDASNETIHAIKYVAFDMNPDTNEGNLSYWMNPGGNINESARGFLFNITADGDRLAGCGVSGSTQDISIRSAVTDPSEDNVLAPTKYWHPREDQNIHPDKDDRYTANEGNSITKQCFTQGADGIYAIDTEKTTHDRGYDVIETEESDVVPPAVPEEKLEGEFIP